MSARLTFIRPLNPSAAVRPPKGDDWLHEPKWDGFRFQIIKDGSQVRSYSRHGAEYTDRLPAMVEAFGKMPTQSAILDGELVLIDPRGAAHFYRLMAEMRKNHPDESQLVFLVFDILHQDNVDLRALPLSERKRDLTRLCRKSKVPFMKEVQTFPNGPLLPELARYALAQPWRSQASVSPPSGAVGARDCGARTGLSRRISR